MHEQPVDSVRFVYVTSTSEVAHYDEPYPQPSPEELQAIHAVEDACREHRREMGN